MNALFRWITGDVEKRLIAFVLKRSVGRFVNELDPSQVEYSVLGGKMKIENVQLNTKGINEHLRDIPLELSSGHIECIEVDIPRVTRIFEDSMKFCITGLGLNFKLKDCIVQDHISRTPMSSVLTESIIGDPTEMATSIIVDSDNKSNSDDFNVAQSTLARAVEQIVSKIKITIRTVTVRFEFPTEKNNILVLHFPELQYCDETKMPIGNDALQRPSVFTYAFLFKGFFVQLFDEDLDELNEKDLNEGNSIVLCETVENAIRIITSEIDNRIKFSFDVSSIHAVFMPKHVQILVNIVNAIGKTISQSNSSLIDTPVPKQTHQSRNVEHLSTDVVDRLFDNVQLMQNLSESVLLDSIRSPSFKDVEEFQEIEEYSESDEWKTYQDELVAKKDSSNDISLEAIFRLRSSTCSLLYESTDMSLTWKDFRRKSSSTKNTNIVNGPNIPVDHLSVQGTEFCIRSINGMESNEIMLSLGNLAVIEKIIVQKVPKRMSSLLSSQVINNYIDKKKSNDVNSQESEQFIERHILEFTSDKSSESKLDILLCFDRYSSKLNLDMNMEPIQLNLNLGFVSRFITMLQRLKETKKLEQKKVSTIMISDVESDTPSMDISMNSSVDYIRIVFSFPEVVDNLPSKTETKPERLVIEIDNLKCKHEQTDEDKKIDIQLSILDVQLLHQQSKSTLLQISNLKASAIMRNVQGDEGASPEIFSSTIELFDEPVALQRAFDSAAIIVTLHPLQLDIALSKTRIVFLQEMIQMLTVTITQLSVISNVEPSTTAQKQSNSTSLLVKLEPYSRITVTILSDSDKKHLRLILDQLFGNIYFMSHHDTSSTYQIHLKSQNISVDELEDELPHHLIRNHTRFVRGSEMNAFVANLSIHLRPWEDMTQVRAQVSFNGIHLELRPNLNIIQLLNQTFATEQATKGVNMVMASLSFNDVCIDYKAPNLSRVLFMLCALEIETPDVIVSTVDSRYYNLIPDESSLSVYVRELMVMVNNRFGDDLIDVIVDREETWSELGFLIDLRNWGFLECLSLDTSMVVVSMLAEGVTPTRERPPVLCQISNGALTIMFCKDSLNTVIGLLKSVDIEKAPEQPSTENLDFEVKRFGQSSNLLHSIQEDQFRIGSPHLASHIEEPMGKQKISFNIMDDYLQVDHTSDRKDVIITNPMLKSHDDDDYTLRFESFSNAMKNINEDHFPRYHMYQESISRILSPEEYSIPATEIVVRDIDLIIYLYDGNDWDKTRDVNRFIRTSFMDCFVQYDSFKEEDVRHVYRARLSIKDIEVQDKNGDHNVLLLSQWNDEKKPREDNSRALDLVIESIKAISTGQELRIKFELLPIHIDLYQDTLAFVCELFVSNDDDDGAHGGKAQEAPTDNTFFQSFTSNEILILFDYRPSNFNIGNIRRGKYGELINLLPLDGAQAKIKAMDIRGQNGISSLTEAITDSILSQITGTDIFRFTLGVVPIRSLYNVSSGIADLVILPLRQYQRDGRVLRGLRRGVTSFASNIGTETVATSASGFRIVNYLFSWFV